VSGRRPGFVDAMSADAPTQAPPAATEPAAAPLRPVLMEPAADAPAVIEQAWQPPVLLPRGGGGSTIAWLAGGVALLLLGWVGLSSVELVLAAFARATAYGWAAAAVVAAASAMILWAGWREWRAWRALARVDRLRALLAGEGDADRARAAALSWLEAVAARLPEPEAARAALRGADGMAVLRAAVQRHVAAPLGEASAQAGQRAALQAGALVALCPHPALDALLAGGRGLMLVREVAAIHGVRPGALATMALVRRVVATAAGTVGVELLSQSLSDQLLQNMPVLRHVAGAVPGATLAAVRLYRLARFTALACSPLARRGG
jgi:putative membrane protein